jgi:hypothetical protein
MGSFMNLSHRVKLLTSTSAKVSYSIYGRLSSSDIWKNGALVIGCCIMTMLLLIPLSLSLSIQQHPTKNMPMVLHPLYSSDLALVDFILFPRLKMKFKGKRVNDILEIRQKSKDTLQDITK